MRRLLMCPACMKTFDMKKIRKGSKGFTCPDVSCVGHEEMYLVEPDIIMEPIIKRLVQKGWYVKLQKNATRSGRLGYDSDTVIEFFPDAGLPNNTVPERFVWQDNVLKSCYPESEDFRNLGSLWEWSKFVNDNMKDNPLEFPEDYVRCYSIVENQDDKVIKMQTILQAVSSEYGISIPEIKSRKRDHKIVEARQIVMFLLKCECQTPNELISQLLAYQKDEGVAYGIQQCIDKIGVDVEFTKRLKAIRTQIA